MRPPARAGNRLVSVIVPCSNRLDFTRGCVTSLVRHTRPPWELIFIDDGSRDGTADYLRGIQDASPRRVEVVTNSQIRGLLTACHQGLAAARGDYLVLLDNGAVVTDAWLDMLIALAEFDPKIGMVGPMSNHAPPPQLVESVPYRDLDAMQRFASAWRAEHRGRWLTTPKLSEACVLIKRAAFEAVGGLEERSASGLVDEPGQRMRRAGYDLAVARDLFVHRHGSRTFAGAGIDADAGGVVAPTQWSAPGAVGTPRAERPTVSLTMIVRDEEENLPACLGSTVGLFDEIVVVDTGSKDRTVEVALSFGAKVFEFAWVDDFAAARNVALGHATGDYTFWLDADDVVEPGQFERLHALFDRLGEHADEPTAYVVRCSCDADATGNGATVVDHIRLFPRRPDVRWAYRVHEQILPALRKAGIPVRWSDVTVRHTGYVDPAIRARKLGRDHALLEAELARDPSEPFVLFNLAGIALERARWGEALDYLRRSLANSAPSDSITRKLHAMIARTHQALGDTEAALAACSAGLAQDPEDAELLFRRAVLHRRCGDPTQAEACWRRVLTLQRPEKFSSVDPGIYGHLTRRNLASLAEERGDLDEAARLWAEVLGECPGDGHALAAHRRLAEALAMPVGVCILA